MISDPYLPFLLMMLLSILILIFAYVFDQDKTQKHLETLKEEWKGIFMYWF